MRFAMVVHEACGLDTEQEIIEHEFNQLLMGQISDQLADYQREIDNLTRDIQTGGVLYPHDIDSTVYGGLLND